MLATTLSPTYGIYSGYESCENVPLRPGSEEYLHSEKYELRERALDGQLLPLVQRLNELRRAHPALTRAGLERLTWLETESEHLLGYARTLGDDVVLCVVNLDPFAVHDGVCADPSRTRPAGALRRRRRADGRELRVGRAQLRPPRARPVARLRGGARVIRCPTSVGHPQSARGCGRRNCRCRTEVRHRGRSMSEHWFESQPNWFKTAVFYELHTRAFFDSSDDGMGDFRGLRSKLDYLQWLGIDCIWLLPFYPSPLRDGGYDISDFLTVSPEFGTVDEFASFVESAHERGMRVITDFVMNHTSSEHPWFQESRLGPDSPKADWYVWSDTVHRYEDARIIFVDSEQSNWTYDPQREAYYWHRFYHHQPDLNYENPEVGEAMLDALRFWLDLGLDGFRLDAVPYLFEEEGTNCENLPPTHAFLKRVRAEVDAGYSDRVLLAEANQWPEDVVDYFGDGDECHMAFHFPVMPRMFMALRREEARPIVEILDRTPPIPDNCQWGIFLRNHDELTLEMVTDEERDYMYAEYARDPRMKLNLGIRRRLAPLLDGGRDEIELMHAILFSLPGSPVLYYGDEIGMGDNVYLGDRDGVRTPMQWTGDRNGGFSRADFAQLYLPPLMDPVFGFQAVNVEAQLRSPTSLLRWLQRFVALRKEHPVFGVGKLRGARDVEPAGLRAHSPVGARHGALRAQPRPLGAGGGARPLALPRADAGRDDGSHGVPADRRPAVPPHLRPAWLLLVPPARGERRCVTRARSGATSCSRSSAGRAGSAPRAACPRTPRSSTCRSRTRPSRSRSSRCASRQGRTSTTSSRWARATRRSTSSSDRRWRRASPRSPASPAEGARVRPVDVEQSNSSVVLDELHMLKLYRRLEAGPNPELELLRVLALRAVPERARAWRASSRRPGRRSRRSSPRSRRSSRRWGTAGG